MKFTVRNSAVILNLLLVTYLATARSLPLKQKMTGENRMVTRREANSGSSSNYNENTILELQINLANLSIPSYLKALYINLTSPNGVARPSSNQGDIKINTIQSYKNKAESK